MEKDNDNNKMKVENTRALIFLGLLLLTVGFGLSVFKLNGDTTPASDSGSNTFPYVVFIPIWTSMIPILIANKKKGDDNTVKERNKLPAWFFMLAAVVATSVSILYLILR